MSAKKSLLLSMFILGLACGSKPKVEIKEPAAPSDPAHAAAPELKKDEKKEEAKREEHAAAETGEPTKIEKAHTDWSYAGLTGPEMWGEIKTEYAACKGGKIQSPIDLKWHKPKKGGDISFNYKDTPYNIVDNGHTIQINFDPGNEITIHGQKFTLIQTHFHAGSEHTISGRQFPLEAHFVHKSNDGQLAVVAVLFKEGEKNPYLDTMWDGIPSEKNRQVASDSKFNPINLIPTAHTHYNYSGSLTTPPCTEGVNWNVFNTAVEASPEQFNQFKVLYSQNARPTQPLNNRKVLNF